MELHFKYLSRVGVADEKIEREKHVRVLKCRCLQYWNVDQDVFANAMVKRLSSICWPQFIQVDSSAVF